MQSRWWGIGLVIIGLSFGLGSADSVLKAQNQPEQQSEDLLLEETPGEEPPPEEEEDQPLAFDYLPKAKLGYVDWVAAIKQGVIKPLDSLEPGNPTGMPPINFDVLFQVKGDLPDVVFPHFPHTLWLDCRNCHPSIFLMRAGSNPITMAKILQGEFCGRCHGVVAFPISDCFRCHSRPK
jgi:c(7)-type cytochrome triheme protein